MSDTDTTTTPTEQGASAGSVLGSMKARRQQILEEQILDLPVPRWHEPEIIVRYKPVDHGIISRALTAIEKAPGDKRPTVEVQRNSDVLIAGCVAVVARIGGKEYSLREGDPEGDPTKFDDDLAANLGLDVRSTARDVVRALFITDGDIVSAASRVVDFSGYKETEADEKIAGE